MDSKLPLYQWLVALIPGCVFLFSTYILLHYFGRLPPLALFQNEAVATFAFLAAGLVTGEALQALSSVCEPVMVWTWGGRPSTILARQEKQNAPFAVLRGRFGEQLSEEDLFQCAMALCNHKALGRSENFNMLYGYARSLFVGTVLLGLITLGLMLVTGNYSAFAISVFVCELLVALLFWARAKKRGMAFASEIVSQAVLAIEMK
ncbi:hypothetical protein C4568_01545 [Candidatus Parcubacteria bacterium]|nr:MAG: hypothetical protein C4568_01545 [Candidatus Parcubacteria bacterium]